MVRWAYTKRKLQRYMNTIYDKLSEYSDSDFYGFHMPGHKRNTDMLESSIPYQIDITEIEGFDDLHHAQGMLKEAQARNLKRCCGRDYKRRHGTCGKKLPQVRVSCYISE